MLRIITDSACDMGSEEASKLGVEILPLRCMFGDEEFLDGVNMSHDDFFHKLIETDVFPTTSQISPYDYEQKFKEVADAGDKAICITISAKLSGCFQSANIAAEDYSDSILVVDSANACLGQRILVEKAVRLRDAGIGFEALADTLNEEKKNIRLVALIDTLEYLKKGGRISPAVAFAGNLLSIKPVISIVDGEILLLGKARGSKAADNKLNELIQKEGAIDFDQPVCLAYSGLSDGMLRKYMADNEYLYEGHLDEISITSVGCAIGTHIGPGAIAAAFFVKK